MLSFLQVTDREGSVEARLRGVTLELYCVLETNRTKGSKGQSQINISHFSASHISSYLMISNILPSRSDS